VKSSFSARRAEWRINCLTIKSRGLSPLPLSGSPAELHVLKLGWIYRWIEIPWGPEIQWRLVMLQVVYVTNYGRGPESKKSEPRSCDCLFSFLSLSLFSLSIRLDHVIAEILLTERIPVWPRLIENLVLVPAVRQTRSNTRTSICHDIAANRFACVIASRRAARENYVLA